MTSPYIAIQGRQKAILPCLNLLCVDKGFGVFQGIFQGNVNALQAHGFEAMQNHLLLPINAKPMIDAGVICTATLMIDFKLDAKAQEKISIRLTKKIKRFKAQGYVGATIILGNGLESAQECVAKVQLIEKISVLLSFPLLIELHRGSVTETLDNCLYVLSQLPKVSFNADFSHWMVSYRLDELSDADFSLFLKAIQPIVARCGFLHCRYASSDHAQLANAAVSDVAKQRYLMLVDAVKQAFEENAVDQEQLFMSPEMLPAYTGYVDLGGLSSAYVDFCEPSCRLSDAVSLVKDIERFNRADAKPLAAVDDNAPFIYTVRGLDELNSFKRRLLNNAIAGEQAIVALGSVTDSATLQNESRPALLQEYAALQAQWNEKCSEGQATLMLLVRRASLTHNLSEIEALIAAYPSLLLCLDLPELLLGSEVRVDKLPRFYRRIMRLRTNIALMTTRVSTCEHLLLRGTEVDMESVSIENTESLGKKNRLTIKQGLKKFTHPYFYIQTIYRLFDKLLQRSLNVSRVKL